MQRRLHEDRPAHVYVARVSAEEAIARRLRDDGDGWLSIEGEAGTGKSTLLARIHSQLVTEALDGAAIVPIFADSQGLLDALADTSLGFLVRDVELASHSVWDGLAELAQRLRSSGRGLVVCLDTLDAGLLVGGKRSRLFTWLRHERERAGVGLISACRPLEADEYLPADRRIVALKDFTVEEAREAIDGYVEIYHRGKPQAVRDEARRVVRHHLETEATAALCRLPITLRMMFEAYDHPPPESLNRARLFDDFWRARVTGVGGEDRQRRATPDERVALALDLAFAMVKRRADHLSGQQASAICDGRDRALQDLKSDRVIEADRALHHRFFHQAFLEHTAARAILRREKTGDRAPLDAVLEPLGSATTAPWYALLEEVAIQAEVVNPEITKQVVHGLMTSGREAALSSAATIWCHVSSSAELEEVAAGLRANPAARRRCARTLYNAAPQRVRGILDDLAGTMWSSGDLADPIALLEGLARCAYLDPTAVEEVLDDLQVAEDVRRGFDLNDSDRGHLAAKVGAVYVALLGVGHEAATKLLDELAVDLRVRNDAAVLTSIVEAIAQRTASVPAARALIQRWIADESLVEYRGVAALRAAFGRAVASWSARPSEEELRAEVAEVLRRTEASHRRLAVWRERIIGGVSVLDDAVWPTFLQTEDAILIADIGREVLLPLAHFGHEPLLERALALVPVTPSDRPSDVRRTFATMALTELGRDVEPARRIADAVGVVLLGAGRTALRCAVRVSPALAAPVFEELLRILTADLEAMQAVLAWVSDADGRLAIPLVAHVLAVRAEITEEATLSHVARLLHLCDSDLQETAMAWLEELSSARKAAVRRKAFPALGAALRQRPAAPKTVATLHRLVVRWSSASEDSAMLGEMLEATLAWWHPDASEREALLAAALRIIRRGDARMWRARTAALDVLDAIGNDAPEALVPVAGAVLDAFEAHDARPGSLATDELLALGSVAYHVSRIDPVQAWRSVLRLDALARRLEIGEKGLRNLAARVSGVVRTMLADDELRRAVVADVPALSEAQQYDVMQWAAKLRLVAFLDETAAIVNRLKPRARARRVAWERARTAVRPLGS